MNETNHNLLSSGTTSTLGYSGTINGNHSGTINGGTGTFTSPGITLRENSTINYSHSNITSVKDMTPKQVHVAVFTITRDEDTNEINSTKFLKELWIEQKNGTSIDLLVAKQLGNDFDPELTIIKTLSIVNF